MAQNIGMTPYMAHACSLQFLHQVSQFPMEVRHQMYSPDGLLPGGALEPCRPAIRCFTLMVLCMVRPYHRQFFSATASHQMLYPDGLRPGEALALPVSEALLDFPTCCEWTPDRRPRRSFSAAKPATDATHAPLGGLTSLATSILAPLTAKDTNMVDSEVTPLAHSRLPHSLPTSL